MEKRTPPPAMDKPAVTALDDGIYEIATPPVGFISYLIVGEKKAVIIDTGMGVSSVKAEAEKLTDRPLCVINTHGHPDHAGGNSEFEETYLNPADFDVFERMASLEFRTEDIAHMPGGAELVRKLMPTPKRPAPLEDGQTFDLGGRTLKIVFAPGHTHGSLCVLDEKTGCLFVGDNAMRRVSLHEWNSSSLPEYKATLQKLIDLKPAKVLGGHRPNVNPPELLTTLLGLVDRVLVDGQKGEVRNMRGTEAFVLEADGVQFDYTADHLA